MARAREDALELLILMRCDQLLIDTFMQRTKRLYADTRTASSAANSNLDRLNEDLQDVTRIMTKNMEDLLWRGDSLDRECACSSRIVLVEIADKDQAGSHV